MLAVHELDHHFQCDSFGTSLKTSTETSCMPSRVTELLSATEECCIPQEITKAIRLLFIGKDFVSMTKALVSVKESGQQSLSNHLAASSGI